MPSRKYTTQGEDKKTSSTYRLEQDGTGIKISGKKPEELKRAIYISEARYKFIKLQAEQKRLSTNDLEDIFDKSKEHTELGGRILYYKGENPTHLSISNPVIRIEPPYQRVPPIVSRKAKEIV